jgi:hypothetical protein
MGIEKPVTKRETGYDLISRSAMRFEAIFVVESTEIATIWIVLRPSPRNTVTTHRLI